MDTRKTTPGLRHLEKYAVHCGGGVNHRMGLYDAILLKENHIKSLGSIAAAVTEAKKKQRKIEVEVENLAELEQAIAAGADMVMLDNFTEEDISQAVALAKGKTELEVSGNMTMETIAILANTGVDYISMGALTKNVSAIDFSLLLD